MQEVLGHSTEENHDNPRLDSQLHQRLERPLTFLRFCFPAGKRLHTLVSNQNETTLEKAAWAMSLAASSVLSLHDSLVTKGKAFRVLPGNVQCLLTDQGFSVS